eukprot:m.226866 g.226866  ORF g.226866 m.226866 type:complete len:91 (-) comp15171_c0_seq18:127-399(-)
MTWQAMSMRDRVECVQCCSCGIQHSSAQRSMNFYLFVGISVISIANVSNMNVHQVYVYTEEGPLHAVCQSETKLQTDLSVRFDGVVTRSH